MADCIFCQIAEGDQDAHRIFEDDDTVAFLDLNPLADGHTLVVPKAHYRHLQDVAADDVGPLFAAVQRVTRAVQAAFDAPAATVGIHNGAAAGQAVPHLHVHVIPRHTDDGGGTLHSVIHGRAEASLDAVRERVADAIGSG